MRSSGIYMSIGSLPSPGGNGTLGQEAREFIDWLVSAGFSVWHMPPVSPVSEDSGILSLSCGEPLFIDVRTLCREGLLSKADEDFVPNTPDNPRALRRCKYAALSLSYEENKTKLKNELAAFVREKPAVGEYALFMAVRSYFGKKPWTQWSDLSIRYIEENALNHYRRILSDEVDYYVYLEYLFDMQWKALKAYAASKGVRLMVDMPLYTPENSCDVWYHPELFQFDARHRLLRSAAAAPSPVYPDGELWHVPAYNWKACAAQEYAWWLGRFKNLAERFDIINLLNFNDYALGYTVKSGAPNARVGIHDKGPGLKLFYRVKKLLPDTLFAADTSANKSARARRLLRFTDFYAARSLTPVRGSGSGDLSFLNDTAEQSVIISSTAQSAETWWKAAGEEICFAAGSYLPARSHIGDSVTEAALGSMADLAIVSIWDIAGLENDSPAPDRSQLSKSVFSNAAALDLRSMNSFFQRTATEE